MQLSRVLPGDQALLYMERYVDEGTRTYSPFAAKSEAAPEYQPRDKRSTFELPTVLVQHADVTTFNAEAPGDLLDFYVQPAGVRFPIHPETWHDSKVDHMNQLQSFPPCDSISVAPTASTRTVLTTQNAENVPTHFLKLHYPHRISRFNRRLRRKNIQTSVETTRCLAQIQYDRFAYLPDCLGVVFGESDNDWGFVVRGRYPQPFLGQRVLIPFFALYGGDLFHRRDPPLLVQLINQLGAEPQSFVVDEIMTPVLMCWAQAVRGHGILLESHAQNLLLEVDEHHKPTRIVHRDFDVWVDHESRIRTGLGRQALTSASADGLPFPREQHYSLVYDHFIGRELFGYLLNLLTQFYSVKEGVVQHHMAEVFHQCFPDADELFPRRTTYYFSNEILPGNKIQLVDTESAPVWR